MSETRRNFMVGLFVLAGLGAAASMMALFGETPAWLGGAEWELSINVRHLSGVQEGTPVNMNGVEVGRVGRLEFNNLERPDRGVSIIARIKKTYVVPRDTKARIYVSPIGLGRSRVELVVPEVDSKALPFVGATIGGEMANVLEDIMPPMMLNTLERTARQIGDFSAELTPVAQDLHDILDKRTIAEVDEPTAEVKRITANLYTLIQRFDQALKHFNDVLGDPEVKSSVREAIADFRRATADGRATFANLRETSDAFKADMQRITAKAESTVDNLNTRIDSVAEGIMPVLDNSASASAYLNQVARELAEGNGTAGLVLRDARMYESLLISIDRLTDLVDTFRRLAAKFERQGYIDIKLQTAVGPMQSKWEIPKAAP